MGAFLCSVGSGSVGKRSGALCLTAELFRLRRVTWKSNPSNQGCLLLVGPDFVGFLHSGLAPWARAERASMPATALSPHPCGSTHCARPPFSLHPSRDWRWLGFLCTKIKSAFKQIKGQMQINSFPAKAGPTRRSNATGCTRSSCRTGLSREEARMSAVNFGSNA
jgi:hypothetical protein